MTRLNVNESSVKISVLIPCKNEERHIAACIESVTWADEIFVVVDAASSDATAAIARRYTDRVVLHEYENSAAQKNWAIPQTAHDWVLIVDADERVAKELAQEIQALQQRGFDSDAYYIYRRNHFLGKEIRYSGWQRDRVIRLFRKAVCRYPEKWVHADLEVDGRIGVLEARLLHYTCDDFEEYVKKWERYTTWAARDRAKKHRRIGLQHLIGHPLWRFFRQFILNGGFLDGYEGYLICRLASMSVFMKYAKAWALQKREAGVSDSSAPLRK